MLKNQYNWNILDKKKNYLRKAIIKKKKRLSINKENSNNFFIIKNLNLKNSKILYQNKDKSFMLDKIFVNLNQNIENSYKLDGSFSLDSKPIVFKYAVELAENYINLNGKLKSNNLELNNKEENIFFLQDKVNFILMEILKILFQLQKQKISK